jgi:parallel beta-helix repeat protein
VTINNTVVDDSDYAFFCYYSNSSSLIYSNITNSMLYIGFCDNLLIDNNQISNPIYLNNYPNVFSISSSSNNVFKNNTIFEVYRGFRISGGSNNSFYYNNFSDIVDSYFYYSGVPGDEKFNISVAGYPQGNTYDEYCDMGFDENSDGFADNISAIGAADWPMNYTVNSKMNDATDYGPKIQTCPAEDQFLGVSSRGGSSAAVAAAAAAAAAAPAAAGAAPAEAPEQEVLSSEEVLKYLKPIITSSKEGDLTKIHISLENTGDKAMLLLAALNVDYEDAHFILKSKTMAYEGSFGHKLMGIAYSTKPVAERLSKATIIQEVPGEFDKPIRLEPGEKYERTIEIAEGFAIPRQIQFEIDTFGDEGQKENILAQDIEIDSSTRVSAIAVDLDTSNNLIDIYTLIAPQSAGVKGRNYFIELAFNKKDGGTDFGDFYGPYWVQEQPLVFAQQYKYNPEIYNGDYIVNIKIMQEGRVVVDKEFPVKLEYKQ